MTKATVSEKTTKAENRKAKKNSDLDLLLLHFNGELKKKDVPDWYDDDVWMNKISQCPVARKEKCEICEKLCFSTLIRGEPPQSLEWFKNERMDSEISFYWRNGNHVRYNFNRYILPNEMRLRNIMRDQLLGMLVLRFRGHYWVKDDIDFIAESTHFAKFSHYLE